MAGFDLHVHSSYSTDAGLRPEDIVRKAVRRGLSGVAVTDHGTVRGGLAVRRLSPPDFIAIPGAEVRTARGELLVMFIEEEVRSRDLVEVIDEVRGAGGLVVLPHPFDWMRRLRIREVEEVAGKVDAIEVLNARCPSARANAMAWQLARRLSKPFTAGSDAHFAVELGRAQTIVEASSEEEVRKAILSGHTKVSGGTSPPYVHLMSWAVKVARAVTRRP